MNERPCPTPPRPACATPEFTQAGAFAEAAWRASPAALYRRRPPRPLDGRPIRARRRRPHDEHRAQPQRARDTHLHELFSGFARYEHDLAGATPATLFAGLGRVQRFPDYWELIKNESAASVSAFGIRPETTTQLDAGAVYRRGPVEFSVSVFAARDRRLYPRARQCSKIRRHDGSARRRHHPQRGRLHPWRRGRARVALR
jgi:iron complex outermembrane receptor protein